MKRISVFTILAFILLTTAGQVILNMEDSAYVNSSSTWGGVSVSDSKPNRLKFSRNSITSANTKGYMLRSGRDNYYENYAHNLDNSIISGNKFDWKGPLSKGLTHGIMAGYNINYSIKHNLILGPYYGIVHEGGYDEGLPMTNTMEGIYYNIFSNTTTAIMTAGFENVYIYNNIFYRTLSRFTHGIIRVSTSNGTEAEAPAKNVKIKNNIFYVKSRTYPVIELHKQALEGFECDYNIYYCEEGISNEPVFDIGDKIISWDDWRALGYDEHSMIINPCFTDTVSLVPGKRLDYGFNTGPDYVTGLSASAKWVVGSYPKTKIQDNKWQVGAYIH